MHLGDRLDAADDLGERLPELGPGRGALLEQAGDAVDSEFMQVINNLVSQLESQNEEPEIVAKLKDISREVLRFSMERNLARENPA